MSIPGAGVHRRDFLDILSRHGASGLEGDVAQAIASLFSKYSPDVHIDRLGNVIAHVCASDTATPVELRPRVLLTAHMDEIALMVTEITDGGFLRVTETGGFDARTLVGQEVVVHGKEPIVGIVGSTPPHLSSAKDRSHAATLADLYIDVAMKQTRVEEFVQIGDRVTVRRSPLSLQNDRISAKAADNRSSIAILLECLASLQELKHPVELHVAATVQEEFGMVGARTVAHHLQPDIAIAADVTFGALPGQAPHESFRLGYGATISYGPRIHRRVFERLRDTAVQLDIPYQIEVLNNATGTEVDVLQVVGNGIAVGLVGIPLRYMHTAVETVDYADIALCGRLLANTVASFDHAFVEELSCY